MTTLLQPFEPGKPYLFNGTAIPSQQTLPPAGQQSFAFRPACSQLSEVSIPGNSAEVSWGMAYNNQFYSFSIKPSGMSQQQAHLYLDAEGNCKIQGVEVPLVAADSLPKPLLPEVSAIVEPGNLALESIQEMPLPPTSMVGVAILLIGLGLLAFGLSKQPVKPVSASVSDSGLEALFQLVKEND